uniref:Dehydrin 13 n=1 Tax=Zea mays TaxID=4577 RepID=B6TXL8_MAIZE|nr:dehydrin 13 [Zea mays]
MSGIIHKIEEKLHMGGDHKNKEEEHHKKAEEHHKKEEGEHHKKDGGEHKEGIVVFSPLSVGCGCVLLSRLHNLSVPA